MNTNLNNNDNSVETPSLDAQPQPSQPTRRKKTMTPAALAANLANAQKSTGPRTPSGKLRSASNAFQHGLYSLRSFAHCINDPNLVFTTTHNLLEHYRPITPVEHLLVQQLIHMQLRFTHLQNLFNQCVLDGHYNQPTKLFLHLSRELDRIPHRITRMIQAIDTEIAKRNGETAHKPIEDPADPIPDPAPEDTTASAVAEGETAHLSQQELLFRIHHYLYFLRTRVNIPDDTPLHELLNLVNQPPAQPAG